MYQSYRENESERVKNLSSNVHRNMMDNIREVVRDVDKVIFNMRSGDSSLLDGDIYRVLKDSHITDVLRIDEENPQLWPITGDKEITKIPVSVHDRNYTASFVIRENSSIPKLRVEPPFGSEVRALYFSPRIVMDFDLVNEVYVIAYNAYNEIFEGIYPLSFYGGKGSSMIRAANIAKRLSQEGQLSEMGGHFNGLYIFNLSTPNKHGFVAIKKASKWHEFKWLPESSDWWLTLILAVILLPMAVLLMVRRYIAAPIRSAIQVIKYGCNKSQPASIGNGLLMPGDMRSLIHEVRALSSSKDEEGKEKPMSPSAKTMSEERFSRRVQQSLMMNSSSNPLAVYIVFNDSLMSPKPSATLWVRLIDELADMVNGFAVYHKNSLLGVSGMLMSKSAQNGLLIWVNASVKQEVLAEELMSHIKKHGGAPRNALRAMSLHVIDRSHNIASSETIIDILKFSSLREKSTHGHSRVYALGAQDISDWYANELISAKARKGFTPMNVSLRLTPVIKNISGEVVYLRVAPYVIDDEGSPIRVGGGDWAYIDRQGSLMSQVIKQTVSLLSSLNHWGFSLTKVCVPINLHWLHNVSVWKRIENIDDAVKQKLVIEIHGAITSQDDITALRRLKKEGVKIAMYHHPGINHSGCPVDIEYTMAEASIYRGRSSLYHRVQSDIRSRGRLVSNLRGADPLMTTSSFCLPGDFSLVLSHDEITLSEALSFMQRDISLNVLVSADDKNSNDEEKEYNNVVALASARK